MSETQSQNEQIDALILTAASDEFVKIAVIISKVYDAMPEAGITPHIDSGKDIAERLYILVDNGRLEVKGNMRRWRDSEIKLIHLKKPA
ncbi:MAG: hypothetical protein GW778_06775 [Alphaproteobacteria bacterium]|nr:hypothetical protein [Alphaproteobacteria bacterium]